MDQAYNHERCIGHAWSVGWIAVLKQPWRIAGPFADIDDADRAGALLGDDARIAYGVLIGPDDFLPVLEP